MGTPNLTAPTEISVTINENLNTMTGLFLGGKAVHLSAGSGGITAAGQ